jgi:glycosyltransferase involved in cell wall biosynthesis
VTDGRPLLVHVTTVDLSLELLLGPQLRAFRDAGYRVVTMSAPGPYVARLEADGIEHIALHHATRSFSLLDDVQALRELVGHFRRLRPDIVHTHNPKPGFYGRIAARVAGVPLVVNTVHGLYAQADDRLAKRVVVYAMERVAAAFSHAELVQSPEDVETLRRLRVPARRLHLLGNGVDLTRFHPGAVDAGEREAARREMGATSPADVVFGTVARLVNEKGIPELVEAAAAVRRDLPHARFAIVGPHDASRADGVDDAVLQRARDAGVTLLGHRDDVVRLYAGMDVFVLPSHREGWPRSVMEASAMGVPTIATDIRGCRQAVDHEVTGLLVPRRDPAALAAAVRRLATDADLRARYATAAAEMAVTRFDVRQQEAITLGVYRRGVDVYRRGLERANARRTHRRAAVGRPDGRKGSPR